MAAVYCRVCGMKISYGDGDSDPPETVKKELCAIHLIDEKFAPKNTKFKAKDVKAKATAVPKVSDEVEEKDKFRGKNFQYQKKKSLRLRSGTGDE